MNPLLVAVIIDEMPALIDFAKSVFKRKNPDEPLPTNEEVIAAYKEAVAQTLAKDAAILAEHGESDR